MTIFQSRRGFALSAAALAAFGQKRALADTEPPEVSTLRLGFDASACAAPQSIAVEALRREGFTDVVFLPQTDIEGVARGDIDFFFETGVTLAKLLDDKKPVVALAGIHPGCYELFANEPIQTIRDLRDRQVGIQYIGSAGHLYLTVMAAHVGLDPYKDIRWVEKPDGNFIELLANQEVDAFLAFPPEPQELRSRGLGRLILSMTVDKPWSQYFCCMAYGHRDFVQARPNATKRYLRAVLKTADFCASDPAAAARRLVDGGFTDKYEYARLALSELPFARWRDYDPEDTLRFYALLLREVGMIKSDPTELIARGTDWRFLNEIKQELKM